jgi:hypothetical protein
MHRAGKAGGTNRYWEHRMSQPPPQTPDRPSVWSELGLALAVATIYVLLIVGGIGLALYLTW